MLLHRRDPVNNAVSKWEESAHPGCPTPAIIRLPRPRSGNHAGRGATHVWRKHVWRKTVFPRSALTAAHERRSCTSIGFPLGSGLRRNDEERRPYARLPDGWCPGDNERPPKTLFSRPAPTPGVAWMRHTRHPRLRSGTCYPHSPSANSGRNPAVSRQGSTVVCNSTPSFRRRPEPRCVAGLPSDECEVEPAGRHILTATRKRSPAYTSSPAGGTERFTLVSPRTLHSECGNTRTTL